MFVDAYNHACRLQTLRRLIPTEFILNAWTKEPKPFRINPSHLILGPYIQIVQQSRLETITAVRKIHEQICNSYASSIRTAISAIVINPSQAN